jgi:hypothetical protein
LKKTIEFKDIEKLFSDVKGLAFKTVIENRPEIILELKSDKILSFRKKLWLSYFKKNEDSFNDLKNSFKAFKSESLSFDNSKWSEAYRVFKERFTVPFEMKIGNIESSILGEALPKVVFEFKNPETGESVTQDRDKIENGVLSQGEKRALYLLNIIFDIESKRKQKQKTLFIIDDIADSFDYKNK